MASPYREKGTSPTRKRRGVPSAHLLNCNMMQILLGMPGFYFYHPGITMWLSGSDKKELSLFGKGICPGCRKDSNNAGRDSEYSGQTEKY